MLADFVSHFFERIEIMQVTIGMQMIVTLSFPLPNPFKPACGRACVMCGMPWIPMPEIFLNQAKVMSFVGYVDAAIDIFSRCAFAVCTKTLRVSRSTPSAIAAAAVPATPPRRACPMLAARNAARPWRGRQGTC